MKNQATRREVLKGSLAVAGLGVLGVPEWVLPVLAQGEVEVPFTITGTTDRPQFTVNMEQILRRAAQKEIQRNLKKGLEQLFRRPKP